MLSACTNFFHIRHFTRHFLMECFSVLSARITPATTCAPAHRTLRSHACHTRRSHAATAARTRHSYATRAVPMPHAPLAPAARAPTPQPRTKRHERVLNSREMPKLAFLVFQNASTKRNIANYIRTKRNRCSREVHDNCGNPRKIPFVF